MNRFRHVSLLLTGTLIAFLVSLASPAMAEDYGNIPVQDTGTVVKVLDGDTLWFQSDSGGDRKTIRMLGINTPEVAGFNNIHFSRDYCGGKEASRFTWSLLPPGAKVQLRSLSASSMNRGRDQRYVFLWNSDTGKYDKDIQASIASAGWAMWFTVGNEPAMSSQYRSLVEEARANHLGIWNPALCGVPEQPDATITLTVIWDAPGNDQVNRNGEYVIVRNTGTVMVDLSGWLLRDSSIESWLTFPNGTVLPPQDYRVVHVGTGTPSGRDLYFNSPLAMFPNMSASAYLGDGAYLLDRNTALRASTMYPCYSDCATDPLLGAVVIDRVKAKSRSRVPAVAANEEYIRIRNVSSVPVRLDGYFLRNLASTYTFPPETWLQPNSTICVHIGQGAPTTKAQYWGRVAPLLRNTGGIAALVSPFNVIISSKAW